MLRILYFPAGELMRTDVILTEVPGILAGKTGLLWFDFEDTPAEDDQPILSDVFHFHPLAIDDALQESHVPKLDDWGEYLYIVLHAADYQPDTNRLETLELDVFLGINYIVTHHEQQIEAIERIWQSSQRDDRHLKQGPDYLLYRITDELVESFMPVVEALDDEIDLAEAIIFDNPGPELVATIFSLKRAVLKLRRIIGPHREVLTKLARDDSAVIDEKAQVYFRDVYDHLVRLHDISESIRDLISGTLDTYLSVVNNRMNDIMKTLTVITTLFMPISFLASFFGMNFFLPGDPESAGLSPLVYTLTLVLMVLAPAGMLAWIRRRRWL